VQITPAPLPQGDVRIYEFGARLDHDCVRTVDEQIFKAHQLYNQLVACMQTTVRDMQAYLLDHAGPDAHAAKARVDGLNEAFNAARAANDENRMTTVATERREAWRALAAVLRIARKEHRTAMQETFLSRIGKKSACETYQLRCKAVADGLGWATANATLDAALIAFKKSFALGRAPRFARIADSIQDTLTLQFTAAGGINIERLLDGKHTELALKPPAVCGKRGYGTFAFRLGAASAETQATGTWQYHRPLPPGGTVGLARLVRRRIGPKTTWSLQLQVRSPLPEREHEDRRPLVTVHPGWAADLSGRRIAGIADAADPGLATVLQLPPDIEHGLQRAAELESTRSQARDALTPMLKVHPWPQELLNAATPEEDASASGDSGPMAPERIMCRKVADEILALRRLPAQHIAIRRLHRLARWLRLAEVDVPDWLETWRKEDKLRWQASAAAAKRARNRRRGFYRETALRLASQYQAIVIEPLNLADAAKKIDEATGERSDFAKKARAGRVVAAIFELDSAIRWAATKCGTAVLDLTGETAQHCAICGGHSLKADDEDSQCLRCSDCGADIDRKRNGAALAWQAAAAHLETHLEDFWRLTLENRASAAAKRDEKKTKLQEGRRAAMRETLET